MKILGIILNTFRESARNKIFYLLIGFGIFFVLISQFVSMLTVGDKIRVLKDIGLASIHFFSVVITIFTGINLIYKEIDKKTIYTIISKPISRATFLLGKFFGLALTLFVALAFMALIFLVLLMIKTQTWDGAIILYFLMLFMEILILTAISLFFSAFSTPILSFIFTLSLFLIGHILWVFHELKNFIQASWLVELLRVFYYLLPNLNKFDIKNAVVTYGTIAPGQIYYSIAYALCYLSALLSLTIVIFRKKEFL